ncbi:MAG: helix-turn-helix transcriptional regulator [Clostridia bacterium]|nr:helix-turn-helix transcriptional regulator [Clostridia bacterium]
MRHSLGCQGCLRTISRYETGERQPGIKELISIADYFQVSIDYLLERTDSPEMKK